MSRVPKKATAFPLSHGLKRPRVEDAAYLKFIRSLPCLVTGGKAEAAHVRYGSLPHGKRETGMSEKPDDRWAVPLSPDKHRLGPGNQHSMSERRFWTSVGIDPLCVAALLRMAYLADDREAAEQVCAGARQLALWQGNTR